MSSSSREKAEGSPSKADEILSVAQALIQTRGYNGFSFRDIAAAVGVKSASIHYHYPTKGDLACAVAATYREAFAEAAEAVARQRPQVLDCLRGYVKLFEKTLIEDDRLCLCGALGGEVETLPDEVRAEVNRFFTDQRAWLADLLEGGQTRGEIRADIDAEVFSAAFLAALEGAMMIARSTDRPQLLAQTGDQLITLVAA